MNRSDSTDKAESGLARLIAAMVIVAGAALSLGLNLPGHLSFDSVVQLSEGREGVYGLSGHPPVMSWLLGVADALMPGAALFVVFDTVLIGVSLVALVLLGGRASWLTLALCVGAMALPQVMIYPAIVWKDVLFAAAATAGFTALAGAARWWGRPAWRYGLLAAASLLIALAALTRQHGAIILPFAAMTVAWSAAVTPGGGNIRRAILHGLGILGASLVVVAIGFKALSPPNTGLATIAGGYAGVQAYDVVSAMAMAPEVPMKVLHARSPWLETLLRTKGVPAYSPVRADTLGPVLEEVGDHGGDGGALVAQWWAMVLHEPLLYARVRAKAFEWVLLTPSKTQCVLIYTGVDGPPDEMSNLGIQHRRTAHDRALAAYALGFARTPIYSHAVYGGVGLVLLGLLLLRRRPADMAVAAMLAAAMSFTLVFAVISIACDYRYIYDLDLSVIAAGLYCAASFGGARSGRG